MNEPRVSTFALARVGAAAAVAAGLAWVVKGAAILAADEQPPLLFEVGPPLFAIGLIGLYVRVRADGGRSARVGAVLACVSLALAAVLVFAWAFANEALPSGDDDFTPLSLVIAGSALSLLGALLPLGVAARRTQALPARLRTVPLVVGLLAVPSLIVGGILAEVSERLLELPLVALALGWVMVGWVVWPQK